MRPLFPQYTAALLDDEILEKGPSIYYVHPQGGWVGCRGVYSDVLWWVGGFSLDVRTHHVQIILKINSSFSGASLVYS